MEFQLIDSLARFAHQDAIAHARLDHAETAQLFHA